MAKFKVYDRGAAPAGDRGALKASKDAPERPVIKKARILSWSTGGMLDAHHDDLAAGSAKEDDSLF
jgi:hypothetical protein